MKKTYLQIEIISPMPISAVLINNSRKRCQPMQKTRRKYQKKIFEWIKESKGEHTVNICELNILETLAKTLFPVESSYK